MAISSGSRIGFIKNTFLSIVKLVPSGPKTPIAAAGLESRWPRTLLRNCELEAIRRLTQEGRSCDEVRKMAVRRKQGLAQRAFGLFLTTQCPQKQTALHRFASLVVGRLNQARSPGLRPASPIRRFQLSGRQNSKCPGAGGGGLPVPPRGRWISAQ